MGDRSLKEVALLFLRLGTTAFGGPAAHIAVMEDEVVRRRGWLTRPQFLDLLGATNLIPGPNSTEMAIHIGHQRAGWLGLLVAGACFIAPATVLTLGIAWAYVRFGSRPDAVALLYGVKPVMIAVVLQALWRLGQAALKSRMLALVGVAAAAANLAGAGEIAVLLAAGVVAVLAASRRRPGALIAALGPAGLAGLVSTAAAAHAAVTVPFSATALFLVFLRIGAVLFGSGYVLLAFLQADLVEQRGWLTEGQLLDAVAVGQITPGPVFSAATFIGYLLAGTQGAALATAGIFLPSFVFVALSGPLVPLLRRSAAAGAFLDGVNVAALALMAIACGTLARAAIVDTVTACVALASAALLLRTGVNSAWLVLAGAVVGFVLAG